MKLTLPDAWPAAARHQARIVCDVARRSRPIHLSMGLMVAIMCYVTGESLQITAALFGSYVFLEMVTAFVHKRMPGDDHEISVAQIMAILAICIGSCFCFAVPAVILAQHHDTPQTVLSMIISFGVLLHVTTHYAPAAVFNGVQIGTAVLVIIWQLSIIADGTPYGIAQYTWGLTAVGLTVFVYNILRARKQMHMTDRGYRAARHDAEARLKELEFHSDHDALTKLLNQRAFDERIRHGGRLVKEGSHICVILIDLNSFKPINDSYTHAAGDRVLSVVARRIRKYVTYPDLAARFGGDEFVVALIDPPSADDAIQITQNILDEIAKPIHWQGIPLSVTASAGVATSTGPRANIARMLAQADQAMYRAKSRNSTHPVLFDPRHFSPRPTLVDRARLEQAISSREIRPYYQPKVSMLTGQIVGFEALARWPSPGGNLVMPGDFIPQIEELGLQNEFSYAIAQACLNDLHEWVSAGHDPGQVSVNIPEATLATTSAREALLSLLREHQDVVDHITLEITEDVFIARSGGQIRDSINLLRDAGARISLDDFGTGFASLRHLGELHIDEVKIDASFVAEMGKDSRIDVLISGLIDIAKHLPVALIAEGVETTQQKLLLAQMGCETGQGFLWDKALPYEDASQRLVDQPYAVGKVACSNAG